jgi:hypothetical protein
MQLRYLLRMRAAVVAVVEDESSGQMSEAGIYFICLFF